MANNKNIIISAAVRGFHVYRASWKPKEDELLECSYEKDNPYDSFSIKVFKPDSPAEIVWHLPVEISQVTKFIIDRGAQVAVKIRWRHYRRSPLVEGGLEVPCEIKITMVGSTINHHLLVRYQSRLKELYIEPKDEEIIGTFLLIRNEHENLYCYAYCYKINLYFLFLNAICHKGRELLEIRGFFSIFFTGINFRGFNKIEYFAGTNFRNFRQKPQKAQKLIPAKISTIKVVY